MNQPIYSQSGTYIALAGLIVSVLAHYDIVISQDSAVAIIAGIVTLAGIIYQGITHKNLATSTGVRD